VPASYATWNPSDKNGAITLSNGNLTAVVSPGAAYCGIRATKHKSSGKWYWELTLTLSNAGSIDELTAVCDSSVGLSVQMGIYATAWVWRGNGFYYHDNAGINCGVGYTTTDILQVALDMDNGKIWYGKNGIWNGSGNPATGANPSQTGLTGDLFPAMMIYYKGNITANFGASAFTYTVPSGFTGIGIVEGSTSEELTLTDAADGYALDESISDTITITDAVDSLHLVDSTTESLTLTDSADSLHLVDITTESLTLTDIAARTIETERSTAESLTLTDAVDSLHLVDDTSETLTLTDAAAAHRTTYAETSESLTLTDAVDSLHLVDYTSETATLIDESYAEEMIRKRIRFPNLQGKHLSLKFESATDGSFALYYLRHKMFKTRELCSDQKHPNTQCSHLSLKLSNSGTDDFTLMYVSEELQLVTT
jgi:hypothetical protein